MSASLCVTINPRLFKKVEMLGAPEERAAPRTGVRKQTL